MEIEIEKTFDYCLLHVPTQTIHKRTYKCESRAVLLVKLNDWNRLSASVPGANRPMGEWIYYTE